MKRTRISPQVIRRLPRYLDQLDRLIADGAVRVSSAELGRQMKLTVSQIRQDFSCFGKFGQQGYGYNTRVLRAEIASILGMDRRHTAVLVGAGNLGRALLQNFGFAQYGFRMLAAFDVLPGLCGSSIAGVPVYHASELPAFLAENRIDAAVLAVPQQQAVQTAAQLAGLGVRAIWNFTNQDLHLSDPNVLVESIRFSDSLLALSYYMKQQAASDDRKLEEPH
ncbi:MAG: redox-sensing transcriptional repressor Rex [Clostridiales bacterium]|nr:redox-sensing transcriptional repressor Rex [Clostridiales bacterium]